MTLTLKQVVERAVQQIRSMLKESERSDNIPYRLSLLSNIMKTLEDIDAAVDTVCEEMD